MQRQFLRTILFCCSLATLAAHAAVPTKLSSNAGEVRDLVVSSATVGYAGTYNGGAWKTTDAGANWTRLNNLPAKTVWKIAFNPTLPTTCIFAATEQGLFRSADGGTNWTLLMQDSTRAVAVTGAATCGTTETVLIGVPGAGVYRSTNGGGTITRSSTGLDSTDTIGLAFFPGSTTIAYVVLQCNVDDAPAPLGGNWGGVYRTANGGVNWAEMNTGIAVQDSTKPCVNAIAANGTTVVVGLKNQDLGGTVFRIVGSGTLAWSAAATNPFGVEWLGPDNITAANGFFLGSNQFGPWRSADGSTYSQIANTGTDPEFRASAYATGAFAANTVVSGIGGIGLFRTTTGGSPWNIPVGPIKADRVADLSNHSVSNPNIYWMALRNGGVMKSTNSGTTWGQVITGLGTGDGQIVRDAQTIAAHPSDLTIVGASLRNYGLFSLAGGGTSWTGVPGFSSTGLDEKAQGHIITPVGGSFYTLFDFNRGLYQGPTMAAMGQANRPLINDAVPAQGINAGAYSIKNMPSDPNNHLFLLAWSGVPYRSLNAGGTWTRVNVVSAANDLGFQYLYFLDLAQKPADNNVFVASTNKGIYRSGDFGATWGRANTSGLAQTGLFGVAYTANNVVWGGDRAGQLWCSVDDGSNWQAVTGGNLGAPITKLKVVQGLLMALTDGAGIWQKDTVCP